MPDDEPISRTVSRLGRRIVLTIVGGVLTIVGAVMLLLPPLPGLLVTAAGLGLLSTEYRWARRMRESVQQRLRRSAAD